MKTEIEVKYLIKEGRLRYATQALYKLYPSVEALKHSVLTNGQNIQQGYMPIENGLKLTRELGIRLTFKPSEARLRNKAGELYFTLKGEGMASRDELETRIAKALFDNYWPSTRGRRVEKFRFETDYEGHVLLLDVYTDRDLILAEVEMPTTQMLKDMSPLGLDVTNIERYKNKNLAR